MDGIDTASVIHRMMLNLIHCRLNLPDKWKDQALAESEQIHCSLMSLCTDRNAGLLIEMVTSVIRRPSGSLGDAPL